MNIFNKILKELPESKIEVVPNDTKDQELANQLTQLIRHTLSEEKKMRINENLF